MSRFSLNVARRGAGLPPLSRANDVDAGGVSPVATPARLPASSTGAADLEAIDRTITETVERAPRTPALEPQGDIGLAQTAPLAPVAMAPAVSVLRSEAAAMSSAIASPNFSEESAVTRVNAAPPQTTTVLTHLPAPPQREVVEQPVLIEYQSRTIVREHTVERTRTTHELVQAPPVHATSAASDSGIVIPRDRASGVIPEIPFATREVAPARAPASIPLVATRSVTDAPSTLEPRAHLPPERVGVPVGLGREERREVQVEIGTLEIRSTPAPVNPPPPAAPHAAPRSDGFAEFAALRRYERLLP
jgi:hypothetical protein